MTYKPTTINLLNSSKRTYYLNLYLANREFKIKAYIL